MASKIPKLMYYSYNTNGNHTCKRNQQLHCGIQILCHVFCECMTLEQENNYY